MPAKKSTRRPAKKARRAPKKAPIVLLKEEAAQADVTPLEYMLQVLNARPPRQEPDEPIESFLARQEVYEGRRMDAAKAAAPYIHAKPAAIVKLDTPPVEDRPVNVLELAKKVAFLFTVAQARPDLNITPLKLN
jgi:hypothetical protein